MSGVSTEALTTLAIAMTITFGGAVYCLLLAWGKDPSSFLSSIGIHQIYRGITDWFDNSGFLKIFEYMDQGSREKAAVVSIILVLLILGSARGLIEKDDSPFKIDDDPRWVGPFQGFGSQDDRINEGESATYDTMPNASQFISTVKFTLTWRDEPDQLGMQNDGDTFRLDVVDPTGNLTSESAKNSRNQDGVIEISLSFAGGYKLKGGWNATVTLEEAGEQWVLGQQIIGANDDSNDFRLVVEWDHWRFE